MRSISVFALSILFMLSAQATYLKPNGDIQMEHFSVNREKLSQEVQKLKAKFTDKFFDQWLLNSLGKKKKEQHFLEKIFSLFKKKEVVKLAGDKLLGDFDRNQDEVSCYQYNGACNLFKEVGYERGTMMLYILEQYGVNSTHHVTEKYSFLQKYNAFQAPFNKEELLSIIIALELFGDNLKYLAQDDLEMTYADFENGRIANALVYFFQSWRESSLVDKISTVLHEMYHKVAGGLRDFAGEGIYLDFSDDWKNLHKRSQSIQNADGMPCFVSDYSRRNFGEDAAESLLAYFHNREVLERLCPQKIKLIEDAIKRADESMVYKKRLLQFLD